MVTVQINPQTRIDKRILKEVASNPRTGKIEQVTNINLDECLTLKEAAIPMLEKLTELYDTDFMYLANDL